MFLEPTAAKVLNVCPVIRRGEEIQKEYIELTLVYEFDESLSLALGDDGVNLRNLIIAGKIDSTKLKVPLNEYVGTFYENESNPKKEKIMMKHIAACNAVLKSPNSEDPNPIMQARFHLPWDDDMHLLWFARRQGSPIITVFERVQAELPGI